MSSDQMLELANLFVGVLLVIVTAFSVWAVIWSVKREDHRHDEVMAELDASEEKRDAAITKDAVQAMENAAQHA